MPRAFGLKARLAEPFSHDPRHQRRIDMLAAYEADGTLSPLPDQEQR